MQGATRPPLDKFWDVFVSIHAPARGATMHPATTQARPRFQFTRPRGARPMDGGKGFGWAVSIHAPARGATDLDILHDPRLQVSIHAPARGATYALLEPIVLPGVFQFTRPRGARLRSHSSCFC